MEKRKQTKTMETVDYLIIENKTHRNKIRVNIKLDICITKCIYKKYIYS